MDYGQKWYEHFWGRMMKICIWFSGWRAMNCDILGSRDGGQTGTLNGYIEQKTAPTTKFTWAHIRSKKLSMLFLSSLYVIAHHNHLMKVNALMNLVMIVRVMESTL